MTIDEMALDEAIAHARAVAKHKRKKLDECNKKNNYACKFCIEIRTCKEVAEEHEQLAEWLEELKDYRDKNKMVVRVYVENMDSIKDKIEELSKYAESQYNKAIDDFYNALAEDLIWIKERFGDYVYTDLWCSVGTRAEQLKAGGKE